MDKYHKKHFFKEGDEIDHVFLKFISRAQDPLLVDNYLLAMMKWFFIEKFVTRLMLTSTDTEFGPTYRLALNKLIKRNFLSNH